MDRLNFTNKLPAKEAKVFRKAMKCYDQKNYKNGIRLCGTILADQKFAKHPEVTCFQALMLYFVGKKDESIRNIKSTIAGNPRNPFAWNSYSIVHKYERNYEEAVKCLLQSVKCDPENINNLIELGSIQIQIRDYASAKESRYQSLMLKKNVRHFWLAYIVAAHLAENSGASKILEEFIDMLIQDNDAKVTHAQINKLIIFLLEIRYAHAQYDILVQKAEKYIKYILNLDSLYWLLAKSFIQLKDTNSALVYVIQLLRMNPDNGYYFDLAEECMPKDYSCLRLYKFLFSLLPNSSIANVRYLSCLSASCISSTPESFEENFKLFVLKSFEERNPNIFGLVKSFYNDQNFIPAIEKVILGLIEEFKVELSKLKENVDENGGIDEKNKTDEISIKDNGKINTKKEFKLTWIYYFISQHYFTLRNYSKSLEYVNLIKKEDFVLSNLLKAKIYHRIGDSISSLSELNTAFNKDPSDRHVNSLLCQYNLKIHDLKKVEKLLEVYCTGERTLWSYMKDIQCLWLFKSLSKMFFASFDFFKAINVSMIFLNFMKQYDDDMLEFHIYCMRKMYPSQYVCANLNQEAKYSNKCYLKVVKMLTRSFCALVNKNDDFKTLNSMEIPQDSFLGKFDLDKSKVEILINTHLSYLLGWEMKEENLKMAFEYYYLTNQIIMMFKTISKMMEICPKSNCLPFYKLVFLKFFDEFKFDIFQKDLMEKYDSIVSEFKKDVVSPVFENSGEGLFYKYKFELFSGKKHFKKEDFVEIFKKSCGNLEFFACKRIFGLFVYSKESQCDSDVKNSLILTFVGLFPKCQMSLVKFY